LPASNRRIGFETPATSVQPQSKPLKP